MDDDQGYSVEWVTGDGDDDSGQDQDLTDDNIIEEEYLVGDEIIPSSGINTISNSLDQIAAENLIYMAQDGNVEIMGDLIEEQVEQADNADYNEHQYFECQVTEEVITEEVITDDWVQPQGEERVEVSVEQLGVDNHIAEELDVPLPTDQDEYTSSRPYPCDFCSRRFRKKANLMNHMVAHKNDRPHICNLCGARYIRRVDLLNHLKVHAQVPEQDLEGVDAMKVNVFAEPVNKVRKPAKPPKQPKQPKQPKKSSGRQQHIVKTEYAPQEDMHMLIESEHEEHHEEYIEPEVERYPVIDPARPFVCQRCGVSFAREKALLSHSKMHGGDSPYECDSCSEMFWEVSLLRDHQKIHHAGQSSNSEYEPDNDQEKDSDSEADSKYGVFYCPVCGMSFHRNELLLRHQKTHVKKYDEDIESNTTTAHSCNVCGESFIEALDLLAHAEVHTRYQPFKCMLCGENFLEESTIKRHIANVHEMEMTDKSCRLCGKQCRDSRSLMKHSWEHSSEKNHSCSKCGKTFHNKARLKRHMQSHRNKSVTCDVCGDEFPDGRTLMNHRHSHTNVSGRQFPCKECGKTFGSRSSQQIHMRIHTGERPYGCRFCWKAFADGGTLRKHERIHTGEKPYACPVCPRAFNQRVVLREHIRSHHSGPDTKYGNSATPYHCSVCNEAFGTSVLLIQHLIEHSDMNTALKRQPPTGPRKYKRRRKLKPHELEQRARSEKKGSDYSDDDDGMNTMGAVDADMSPQRHNDTDDDDKDDIDFNYDIRSITEKRSTAGRHAGQSERRSMPQREKKTTFSGSVASANNDIGGFTVFNNVENTLQSIDALVTPTITSVVSVKPPPKRAKKPSKYDLQPSRPKMIHTQKTRVPVEDGKRKTKTLITRTTAAKETRHSKNTRNRTVEHKTIVKEEDFMSSKGLTETEILLELSRKNLKYSPDVVNDLEEILRSPIKGKDNNDEYITSDVVTSYSTRPQRSSTRRRSVVPAALYATAPQKNQKNHTTKSNSESARKLKIKQSPSSSSTATAIDEHDMNYEDSNIKQEIEEEFILNSDPTYESAKFTCSMCSAVFRDRSQLLLHVPIHI